MRKTEVQTHPRDLSRRTALGAIASAVAWLQGCGGGGGGTGGGASVAGITSGGTGSFTTGTVSGLGSIIVRGVRYDDSRAIVSRNDGGAVRSIRPGMVVAIDAGAVTSAPAGTTVATAVANRIRYGSEWVGRIDAVDDTVDTITVMGQTIEVTGTTVIEGATTQLSTLVAGQLVEVHGYLELSTARLLATHVEVSSSAPPAFRLSGQVSSLDTGARTFRIGTALIGYGTAVTLPAGFGNGALVRASLATTQVAGAWPAQRISLREPVLAGVQPDDRDEGEIEGTVTAFTSSASFSVNGVPVDASGVPVTSGLALGVLVEVEGSMRNGVLVANDVDVKTRSLLDTEEFRFFGTVSNLNVLTRTFTLQGLTFTYGLLASIEVPNWITGATPNVEVRAVRAAGEWQATRIREDS
jgi:hypothetical protein